MGTSGLDSIAHSQRVRALFAPVCDLALAGISLPLAFALFVGPAGIIEHALFLVAAAALFAVVAVASLVAFGAYRNLWRFTSVDDVGTLVKATTAAVLVFTCCLHIGPWAHAVPPALPVVQLLLLVAVAGGARLARRRFAERMAPSAPISGTTDGKRVAVLVIGTGHEAVLLLRCRNQGLDRRYRPVGILAESATDVGRHILGVPILATIEGFADVVEALSRTGDRPERVVLTRNIGGERLALVQKAADRCGIPVSRLPVPTELRAGAAPASIEVEQVALEDLLGRRQVALDRAAVEKLINGRRVLVTGAGGTIGSEICRQLAHLGPAELLMLDSSEFNLYSIDNALANASHKPRRRALLVDIRDRDRLQKLMIELRPAIVFHAAALKHVPLVEHNPIEGAHTNILGTRNVAEAARAAGAMAFVQISTDKAVNPTNVMGASKRMAELYCQALDAEAAAGAPGAAAASGPGSDPRSGKSTRFLTVRFGNVLGSSGSVIPLFKQQLAAGGPLTVTHPSIRRYFMTVREAVELVLQVAANRLGSEEQRGCIFVLDMGEPVRIFDMAEQMVRLTGLTPHKDVKIEIVGLRPGEKLIEELFDACEERLPSSLTGVLRARSRQVDLGRLRFTMAQLEGICQRRDELALQRLLAHWVPGYRRHAASGGGDAVVDAFIAPTFTQWIARDRKTALSEQV